MSEKENLQKLDCLMREDELLFRFGITHLLTVGYENLTEGQVFYEWRNKKGRKTYNIG